MDRKELVANIVSKIKNGVFVEIGTCTGAFADHILSSSEESILYCIDPYVSYAEYAGDSTNNETGDAVYEQVSRKMKEKYNDRIIFIRKFSSEAVTLLPDQIDFLYIDDNHSYPYVLEDLNNYYPKIKPNGFIVGDDAVDLDDTKRNATGDIFIQWPGGAFGHYGVVKAFNEFITNKSITGNIIGNQFMIQKPL
jgi:predicted O-methyltransferase YrrM